MKAYRFLTGADDTAFCHRVTEALANGWELYGDTQYVYDAKAQTMRCGQAIVKTNEKLKYNSYIKLSNV